MAFSICLPDPLDPPWPPHTLLPSVVLYLLSVMSCEFHYPHNLSQNYILISCVPLFDRITLVHTISVHTQEH